MGWKFSVEFRCLFPSLCWFSHSCFYIKIGVNTMVIHAIDHVIHILPLEYILVSCVLYRVSALSPPREMRWSSLYLFILPAHRCLLTRDWWLIAVFVLISEGKSLRNSSVINAAILTLDIIHAQIGSRIYSVVYYASLGLLKILWIHELIIRSWNWYCPIGIWSVEHACFLYYGMYFGYDTPDGHIRHGNGLGVSLPGRLSLIGIDSNVRLCFCQRWFVCHYIAFNKEHVAKWIAR